MKIKFVLNLAAIAIISIYSSWASGETISALTNTQPDCTVNSKSEWISCKNKIEQYQIKKIRIDNHFQCNQSDQCNLMLFNQKDIIIWSDINKKISRISDFQEPIINIKNSQNITISNLTFEESPNIAIQPSPLAQEINNDCKMNHCSPIINVDHSSNITINSSTFLNGKIFAIALSSSQHILLSENNISQSWLFGVWGSSCKNIDFTKNSFNKNRSNAIFFENSTDTTLIDNEFVQNHHTTAFHTCGDNGTTPCPGGQIDFTGETTNLIIRNNKFLNGKMSLEFPEDIQHDWISGIEFEPYNKNITNAVISNNKISNNTGSPVYVNLPAENHKNTFIPDIQIFDNEFCQNKTQHFFANNVPWAKWISSNNNVFCASTPSSPTIGSISATDCKIDRANEMCTSRISWSSKNNKNICVFAGNTLWACDGENASKDFPYVSENPINLILRMSSAKNSQEIARITVVATKKLPTDSIGNSLKPFIQNAGLGCEDYFCLYFIAKNIDQDVSVDIRSVLNQQLIYSGLKTNFSKDSSGQLIITFRIPDSLRREFAERGFYFHIVNSKNGTWSDQYFMKK